MYAPGPTSAPGSLFAVQEDPTEEAASVLDPTPKKTYYLKGIRPQKVRAIVKRLNPIRVMILLIGITGPA